VTDEELPVGVDFDVAATMRDGVVLRANVYRPSGLGPWPALLVRTPYDKNEPLQDLDPMRAARQGFVVVVQDVRGRFASDGEWIPFRFEPHDGYDSVEWAAGLAGVNGRVGMYSASYCGNVQWLAAFERPPSLGAIAPAMTWSDAREGLLTRGGALELGLAWFWALENGFDVIRRSVADPDEAARRADELRLEFDRALDDAYWELPVDDAAVLHRHGVPAFSGIGPVATPEAVRESAVRDRIGDVEIPSFHLSGWYDIFVQGTLDNFVAMQQRGRDATLVVGPWSHELHRDPIGQLNFGSGAARDAPVHGELDADALGPAWLRSRLDVDAPKPVHAPVRIFVMGRNEWRDEQSWPLAQAQPRCRPWEATASRSEPRRPAPSTRWTWRPGPTSWSSPPSPSSTISR